MQSNTELKLLKTKSQVHCRSIFEDNRQSFAFVEVASGANYEVNKTAVKDSDRSIGDRIGHGKSLCFQ